MLTKRHCHAVVCHCTLMITSRLLSDFDLMCLLIEINVCEDDMIQCSNDSTCVSTLGSYVCECNHGFTGNDTDCTGIILVYIYTKQGNLIYLSILNFILM